MVATKSTSSLFYPWGKRRTQIGLSGGTPTTKAEERVKTAHSSAKFNFKIQSKQPANDKGLIKNAVWGNILQMGDINVKRLNYRKLHSKSQSALRRSQQSIDALALQSPMATPGKVLADIEALLAKNPIRTLKLS